MVISVLSYFKLETSVVFLERVFFETIIEQVELPDVYRIESRNN